MNFTASIIQITMLETVKHVNQSLRLSGFVSNALWNSGKCTTNTCNANEMAMAPNNQGFREKSVKALSRSDLALNALKS